jgi:hypothetical protein
VQYAIYAQAHGIETIDKVAEKIYFNSGKTFNDLDSYGVARNDLAYLLLA